jgi:hypothetical protein
MKLVFVFAASALLVGAASAYPARIVAPCQYPHGWNSTDAGREVGGVPNGSDHRCVIETDRYRPGWGRRYHYR